MKEFKSLIRDTELEETPVGSWRNARNILLSKGFNSISNEYGNKYYAAAPGITIGIIDTNTDLIFLIKKADGTDEIGRFKITNEAPVYERIVNSKFFNFKYEHPIEGIFIYNSKGELIIVFCDGVEDTANTPKLVNVDNLGITVNSNKEVLDIAEFNKFNLFPEVKEGDIKVEPLDSGNIQGGVAYITHAYIFDDTSETPYFGVNNIVYLAEGFDPIDKKGIRLNFTNLDPNFRKLKIGLIIKKDGLLTGYESYAINYSGTTKQVDITSLTNFTLASAEGIIIDKMVFNRVESITKQSNQAFVGNYKVKEQLKLQKYFLNLKLKPTKYISKTNDSSFLPDEVYAIYGQVQYNDGTYSEAYHIPGRKAKGTELNNLTPQEITDYNLNWINGIENGNFKNFHIFNNGSVNRSGTIAEFGYWQNEELYPDDSEYDGRTDYNGNAISGGENLANTPIRYHRMPSIKDLATLDYGLGVTDSNNFEYNEFYNLGLEVTNFGEVFPEEVKKQIQGFRISFIKRTFGNSYVAGNYVMTRRGDIDWTQAGIPIKWEYHDFNVNPLSNEYYYGNFDINFSKGRLLSNELYSFRPTLDLTYLRTNYLFSVKVPFKKIFPATGDVFAKVKNNIKYIEGGNFITNTQYLEEGINIETEQDDYYEIFNVADENRWYVANITAYNHKTNLYSGFKSNSLVVVGKSSNFTSPVSFKGGDVFNKTEIDITVHTAKMARYTSGDGRDVVQRYVTAIKIKGLFSPVNSSQLFNNKENDLNVVDTIGDNEHPDRIEIVKLEAQDYTFEVKHDVDLSSINDVSTILTYDITNNYITRFPYRVHRSLKIPKESLSTNSIRTYLSDDYYETANDKGEIIAVRGKDRALYIQYRFSLFTALIKDKLKTDNIDAYLGSSELFERAPEEILSDSKGTIGCVSKFSCTIIKGMYIVINAIDGQIYTLQQDIKEISSAGNINWFNKYWDIGLDFYKLDEITNEKRRVDNPFCSVGYCIGYDEKFKRLLFTKRFFSLKNQELVDNGVVTFDGQFYKDQTGSIIDMEQSDLFNNESYTLSYDINKNEWICDHDYFPNFYFYTKNNHYSIKNNFNDKNSSIYEHNDINTVGTFYGKKYDSYIDLIFTGSTSILKLLQVIKFRTNVRKGNRNFPNETITGLMIFTNEQCSGILPVTNQVTTRDNKGLFNFNNFRDLVIDINEPIVNENGTINLTNIDTNKLWFEQLNFINTFFVVRLIMDNKSENNVFIHEVNLVSLKA